MGIIDNIVSDANYEDCVELIERLENKIGRISEEVKERRRERNANKRRRLAGKPAKDDPPLHSEDEFFSDSESDDDEYYDHKFYPEEKDVVKDKEENSQPIKNDSSTSGET